MSAWSTLRTAAFAAVAILSISLLPRVCAGQSARVVSVEIKLTGPTEEQLRTTYGYELRVEAGAPVPSATPTELGIFREWELSKGDKPQAMGGGRMATFQARTLPYSYGAGEVVYLRWYDHVMSSNPLEGVALREVFYPVSGVVKFVDAVSQAAVGSEQTFFQINEPDATMAEVRIPWQNAMVKEDADRAIYTVLNNAGISNQENPSFALPSYSGDLKMVVTLTMAKKAVKRLEFVPNAEGVSFDGSARVRMKSPGDKGFMMNQIYWDQGSFDTGAFYNAYPYPSATNEKNTYPEILEGWMMAVEKKGNAKDGVCVDGKYGGTLVKISRRRDGIDPNVDARDTDMNWDNFGASPTQSYWLVPLWSDGETIKVKVGPCNAAKLKVHYVGSGALYSNLRLWSDAGCTEGIPNGGTVKSGQHIYVTVDVNGLSDCEGPQVLWNVNDSGGGQATASVVGKYSFTPTGNGGDVVNVWVDKETKETKLVYDDAHYSLFDSNGQLKASGSTVTCGTKVKVKMKNAAVADGCLERVEVQLGGTVKGSIAWNGSGWQPVEAEVRGETAKFDFTRVAKRFSVSWTVGTGYTMKVEAGGSEIPNGATVECDSGVKVTVTPDTPGQRVLSITAVGPNITENNSSTLTINSVSQDITAIKVVLGPDPSKLTVVVSEEFAGARAAQVRVYNRTRNKAIWENEVYVDGGRFEEGDELEVSYVPEGGCVDASEVKVDVTEREGGASLKTLKDGDRSVTIPSASKGIDVRVTASGTKRYGVSWSGTNFEVKQQGNGVVTSGQQVDCGSSITIVPALGACERVGEVKVNGAAVSPDGQGRYVHEVTGPVSSIEVVPGVKMLEVSWGASLGVGVSVGGNSSSPVSTPCGAEVSVVLMPNAGDGVVRGITIGEEGKADAIVTKDGASALGFTWEENQPVAGQTTVKWVPRGNVEIKAVSLPRKFRIHFSDGDGYTVTVTRADGAAVANGEGLLEGTQLTVTVEVTNAAKHKVVKVNGDASGITEVATGKYTYGFSISGETTVCVELGVRKYKVVYAPNALKVSELKVWAGGWSVASGGEEVSSGAEVAYGSVMYVYVRPAGGAVQGVNRVKVKYTALGERDLSVFTDAGEGWYLLDRLEGEVENFEVEVEQLNAGDVYVVYGSAALGGEEERPFGPKGVVRWRKGGADLDAGKKQKVKVSDALKWVLSAAPGVEDGKLRAVCLVVNRQYVAPFLAGERDKDMKLEDVLPAGLLADVQAFRVTTLRLETYVSVLLDARPQLVLTVRKPVLGELEVTMPGAGGAPLDYEVSYKVSGGTTVTVKALAQSPVVLKEAHAGVVNLGLTLGEQKQYQLPEYDAASENGNRIPFFAAFARSEAADNCLLKLEVNDAEAGSLSVMRRGEALENGKEYQRGLSVEIVVQAKEGYFLKSVRQGGAIVFENTQMDTTQLVRTIPMSLPGGTLFIQAEFAKISKRGVLNGVLAGEAFRELTLSPNPTDGVVEVRGATGVVGYMVFDVSGRAVARGAHVGDAYLRLDLRSLAAGYYLVRFYGEDQRARVMGVMRR